MQTNIFFEKMGKGCFVHAIRQYEREKDKDNLDNLQQQPIWLKKGFLEEGGLWKCPDNLVIGQFYAFDPCLEGTPITRNHRLNHHLSYRLIP